MVTVETLLLWTGFLLLAHAVAGIGLSRRAFSASEGFVLGHWPFLFLNLVILHYTGGFDWTSLDRYPQTTLHTAQWIAALGLLGFLVGGLLAVSLRMTTRSPGRLRLEGSATAVLRTALVLVVVGIAATVPNAVSMATRGPEARSTILLGVGELLVPGVLLCWVSALDGRLRPISRSLAGLLFLAGIVAMAFNWSRRPILVTLVTVLAFGVVSRRGFFDRRLLAGAAPVAAIVAVATLLWRNVLVYGAQVGTWDQVVRRYANALWLESSAFSALMLVVDSNGLFTFHGGGSLILPLIFWIPRALFPAKPAAFDPSAALATRHSIGPSIYGEVLVNLSILGLPVFMILLGFVFKCLDLSMLQRTLRGSGVALYTVFVLDTVFVVRGSFHTMVTPIVLHVFAPLVLLQVIERFAPGAEPEERSAGTRSGPGAGAGGSGGCR